MEKQADTLPVHLLDDCGELGIDTPWTITVRVFDGQLKERHRQEFTGKGTQKPDAPVGMLSLTSDITDTWPVFVIADLHLNNHEPIRNTYWMNFADHPDWIGHLPQAKLEWALDGNALEIVNTGAVPAVSVHVGCTDISDTLTVSDNYFWLDSGEKKRITLSQTDITGVGAWNNPL